MFEKFHRLYITIQYGGHLVLLSELHQHLPAAENLLYQHLSTPINYNLLQRLKAKKVINSEQWDILYPSTGRTNSHLFDISLCFVLLRNLCPLVAPLTGWDKLPDPSDRSTVANLVRLKLFRNEFSHGPWNWFISDRAFQQKWKEIESVLKELGYESLPTKVDLIDLKSGPLDAKSERFQAQQKLVNELLRYEQQRVKSLCISYSFIISLIWVLVAMAMYQYLTPGSSYRYYKCSIGRKQPYSNATFQFIPYTHPYSYFDVSGIEFTFENLIEKIGNTNYHPLAGNYRYYLNIDRCAYGGITLPDVVTGGKPIRGPEVFAVYKDCSVDAVYYYTEVPTSQWVRYNSTRDLTCMDGTQGYL